MRTLSFTTNLLDFVKSNSTPSISLSQGEGGFLLIAAKHHSSRICFLQIQPARNNKPINAGSPAMTTYTVQ